MQQLMQKMEKMLDSNPTIAILIVTIVTILTIAITYTITTNHRTTLMAKDIQSALEKGVDPMAIRCSYAGENDQICLVFGAARGAASRDVVKVVK